MTETFADMQIDKKALFEEVDRKLSFKNSNYADREHVFLNFDVGAVLLRTNRIKYGLSLLAKHMVRLMFYGDTMTMNDLLEVVTDSMAYLVLIYSMRRQNEIQV